MYIPRGNRLASSYLPGIETQYIIQQRESFHQCKKFEKWKTVNGLWGKIHTYSKQKPELAALSDSKPPQVLLQQQPKFPRKHGISRARARARLSLIWAFFKRGGSGLTVMTDRAQIAAFFFGTAHTHMMMCVPEALVLVLRILLTVQYVVTSSGFVGSLIWSGRGGVGGGWIFERSTSRRRERERERESLKIEKASW